MSDATLKVCTKCEEELPLSEFHKHQSGKYGVRSQCKPCVKAYNAENREDIAEYHRRYRETHREEKAARDKAYAQKHREKIAEYQKAYRQENAETASEYQRKYREEHREALIEYGREYYKANRHKRVEYSREYYRQNRSAIAAYGREYYKANREAIDARVREYCERKPEVRRHAQNNRRAKIRDSMVVKFSAEDLALRMSYFGNKCWMCSGPFEHIDHVKPISKGGSHMLSNLRPACRSCNSSKSAKWPFTLEDATWLCQ